MASSLFTLTLFLLTFVSISSLCTKNVQFQKNHVCNGDFQQPRVTAGWYQSFKTIPCWTTSSTIFEILQNRPELSGQAMDLNTIRNGVQEGDKFYQEIELGISGFYMLEMDYAANPFKPNPKKSAFAVYFNDELVIDVVPEDKKKHKISERIKGKRGKNTLKLFDKSKNINAGSYVDNIGIYKISME